MNATSVSPRLCVIVPCAEDSERVGDLLWSAMVTADSSIRVVVVADSRLARRAARLASHVSREDKRVTLRRYRGNIRQAIAAAVDSAREPYVVVAEPNGVLIESGYREAVRRLEESGSDIVVGAVEQRTPRRSSEPRVIDGHADVDVTGVSLAAFPGLIGDDRLGNKVMRRTYLAAVIARHQGWCPRLLAAELLLGSTRIDVSTRSLIWDGGQLGSGCPRPGTPAWTESLGRVSRALSAADHRVQESHSRAVLTRDMFMDGVIDELMRTNDIAGASRVVRALAERLESSSLANLPITQRWILALIALGRREALSAAIHGRKGNIGAGAGVRFDESVLSSPAWSCLGLGERDVYTAYRDAYFPPSSPCEVATRRHRSEELDVSVVIPTHNVAPYIDESLDSVLSARGVNLEVVVVDDGSTDGTWERLLQRSAEDPRLRVFRSEGAGGGQARNYGVEQARGPYLAFADGDDIVPPHAYLRMLQAARRTNADIVSGSYVKFFTSSTWNASESFNKAYTLGVEAVTIQDHPQLSRHRAVWSRLIRRQHWVECALPFPGVPRSNDIVPMTSALLAASRLTVVPLPVYVYRDRPGSGSMTSAAGSLDYTVSYFSEEATCAALISQHASQPVAREYWDMVLTSDAWGNVRKFVSGSRRSEGDDSLVATQVANLLAQVPDSIFRSLSSEHQAVWALCASGDFHHARILLESTESGALVTTEEVMEAVSAVAELPIVPMVTISRLVTRRIAPRLVAHYGRGHKPTSTALAQLRTLVSRIDLDLPVLQWSPEASAVRLIRSKGGGSTVSARNPMVDARIRSGVRSVRLVMAPIPNAEGAVRIVAREYATKRSRPGVTIAMGSLAPGAGFATVIPSHQLPAAGAWELEAQVHTHLGVSRHPIRLREEIRRVFPGRLQAAYVAHPGTDRTALRVRVPLRLRVAKEARRRWSGSSSRQP